MGDVVQLSAHSDGREPRTFRVVGIYEPVADPLRLTARRHEARLHLDDLLALATPAQPGNVSTVNVALSDPRLAAEFRSGLEARAPQVLALPAAGASAGDPFAVIERFHVAISIVTVLGSSAFLLALMVIRVEERRETAGILRLLGFARRRLLAQVLLEGLGVAAGGAVFGVVLAALLQHAFNAFFQWHYDTAMVFVRVTPPIAARCVALAVPLGVLAGVVASWTLLRKSPLALLHR